MNHIYDDSRCIFCNANNLDVAMYDEDETCEARDPDGSPYVYTSETNSKSNPEFTQEDPINPAMEIDLDEFFSK